MELIYLSTEKSMKVRGIGAPYARSTVGRHGFSDTKTNSAQAEAGARAELGNIENKSFSTT